MPLALAQASEEAAKDPENYVKPIKALFNGYTRYRLEVKRTIKGSAILSYPDISSSQLDRAEELAAKYAVRHDITLILDDDPDGRFADVAMQQIYERMEREDLSTLWMG